MERAITETARRREIQMAYNQSHGITPQTIVKKVSDIIEITPKEKSAAGKAAKGSAKRLTKAERQRMIEQLTKEMKAAAKLLEFEHAAFLRDKIKQLESGKR